MSFRRRDIGCIVAIALVFLELMSTPLYGSYPPRARSSSGWDLLRSMHFLIYYRPGVPKDFVYRLKRYAEKYYREIVQDLGLLRSSYWIWDDRCRIYVYRDEQDFHEYVELPEWSVGGAIPERREIHCYYIPKREETLLYQVLPHEMTHILFYEARNGTPIPHVIDEGVAMREESQMRVFASHYIVAQALKEGKYIPLEKIFDWRSQYAKMDKETADLFYAESCLLIDFLLTEFPRNFFATFCWRMRSGYDFYRAFRLSYARYSSYDKIDMKRLSEDFWDYVKRTNAFLYDWKKDRF